MSFIDDLYNGDLCIASQRPTDAEYTELERKIVALDQSFTRDLNPEQVELYDQLQSLRAERDSIDMLHKFKLGTRFMLELLAGR